MNAMIMMIGYLICVTKYCVIYVRSINGCHIEVLLFLSKRIKIGIEI